MNKKNYRKKGRAATVMIRKNIKNHTIMHIHVKNPLWHILKSVEKFTSCIYT